MNLLQDLIDQILLRLPVKSLRRFRCVSKPWLSLISDPQFAKLHFELTAMHKEKLLLFRAKDSEIQLIDINAPSLCDSSASVVVKLNFLLPQPHYSARILGTCRGFILFDCYPDLYLWNPTTGFRKRIPPSPTYLHPDPDVLSSFPLFNVHGFGYDPSTDDYLVTVITYHPTLFSYFSLKANTWNEVEGPPFPYINPPEFAEPPRCGLLFNGAIHWLAFRDDRDVDVIAVFDLVERCFSEIDLPHDFDAVFWNLRVFRGYLSLCPTEYADIEGVMWVMEEYKVQSSWAKRDIAMSKGQLPWKFLDPICCTRSGDPICCTRSGDPICCTRSGDPIHCLPTDDFYGLVKFNDKGEVQEYSDLPKQYYGVDMYTESLLSLPDDN